MLFSANYCIILLSYRHQMQQLLSNRFGLFREHGVVCGLNLSFAFVKHQHMVYYVQISCGRGLETSWSRSQNPWFEVTYIRGVRVHVRSSMTALFHVPPFQPALAPARRLAFPLTLVSSVVSHLVTYIGPCIGLGEFRRRITTAEIVVHSCILWASKRYWSQSWQRKLKGKWECHVSECKNTAPRLWVIIETDKRVHRFGVCVTDP